MYIYDTWIRTFFSIYIQGRGIFTTVLQLRHKAESSKYSCSGASIYVLANGGIVYFYVKLHLSAVFNGFHILSSSASVCQKTQRKYLCNIFLHYTFVRSGSLYFWHSVIPYTFEQSASEYFERNARVFLCHCELPC
jgi:hypothetical protein